MLNKRYTMNIHIYAFAPAQKGLPIIHANIWIRLRIRHKRAVINKTMKLKTMKLKALNAKNEYHNAVTPKHPQAKPHPLYVYKGTAQLLFDALSVHGNCKRRNIQSFPSYERTYIC